MSQAQTESAAERLSQSANAEPWDTAWGSNAGQVRAACWTGAAVLVLRDGA